MCGSTTHAVPNRPKPRACLRLTPYHPTNTASVGWILVSDKTFNIPIIAIHCSNAQNVGFENPTYKIIPSIIL
ncbi:TPA: hypothetical protein ACLAKF_000270 [Neisseria meningitidis]|uniref:Uncharacterized protein n=3 Tax=Neisseria meningitidis TaxID=487 RepID=A0A425B5L4_NEIME|nr:hypothetical protein [Neisseria meningitidis]ADY97414.1 hypothetical protein NMBM01240149_0824 [Neisseria meningitidis M01-240149]ADZ03741.1 hypothetical protein NMBNZ0533_1318 [Neisseria meningitidis NZ-05/33]EGC50089.1 hypothetical protein NMXN1568_2256 [Neisseria meningitidis N1568]EGC53196.1 hypothetical protein NMBOX9930304_0823 [Neisseria meningitidis OX99.30304]ELK65989.1 hypothetical protein NM97021_1311 [Neisseria meningitidis 97021]ELK69270.1 hypothetical protein NM2006087_2172 [